MADPGELPSSAQNSSPAAARVILCWAGASWGGFSQFDLPKDLSQVYNPGMDDTGYCGHDGKVDLCGLKSGRGILEM